MDSPGQQPAAFLHKADRSPVNAYDHVSALESGPVVRRIRRYRIDYERHCQLKHSRSVEQLRQLGLVHIERRRVSVPENLDLADIPADQVHLQRTEVLRLIIIEAEHAVAGAESKFVGHFRRVDAIVPVADI